MSPPSRATLLCGSLLPAGVLAPPGMLFGQGRALLKRPRGSPQHRRNIPRADPRLAERSFSGR